MSSHYSLYGTPVSPYLLYDGVLANNMLLMLKTTFNIIFIFYFCVWYVERSIILFFLY